MGFITSIHREKKCEICGERISLAAASGSSYPYNDYSCESCSWSATICGACGLNNCPKCDGQIKSVAEKSPVRLMY